MRLFDDDMFSTSTIATASRQVRRRPLSELDDSVRPVSMETHNPLLETDKYHGFVKDYGMRYTL